MALEDCSIGLVRFFSWLPCIAPTLRRFSLRCEMLGNDAGTVTGKADHHDGLQEQSYQYTSLLLCCWIPNLFPKQIWVWSFYRGCWVIIIVPYCKRYTGTGSGSCPEAVMLFWPSKSTAGSSIHASSKYLDVDDGSQEFTPFLENFCCVKCLRLHYCNMIVL